MATIAVTRRHDLTDAQWRLLKSLLPAGKRPGRPSQWGRRQLIDGIRWRVRVGAPWRDVPTCYGSWQAIYALFRRWQRAGIWQQIVTKLQARADAAGLITWDVSVDSTIARVHQHAAGARRCHQDRDSWLGPDRCYRTLRWPFPLRVRSPRLDQ
ncbi:IS5 family transposase [Micromonospora sp. NPDC004551]|uniref:IS5 family transposase n=1 Tax=Micromonospora sp. NPDC004551 TaxID=3154284 RepID=UPI0033A32DC3